MRRKKELLGHSEGFKFTQVFQSLRIDRKQLRYHPDKLWKDGVQDYIKHASDILVKFSDVVEWLNKNASSIAQNVPASMSKGGLPSIEKQVPNEGNNCDLK